MNELMFQRHTNNLKVIPIIKILLQHSNDTSQATKRLTRFLWRFKKSIFIFLPDFHLLNVIRLKVFPVRIHFVIDFSFSHCCFFLSHLSN